MDVTFLQVNHLLGRSECRARILRLLGSCLIGFIGAHAEVSVLREFLFCFSRHGSGCAFAIAASEVSVGDFSETA